ncbi:MAG: ABC transporter substrate-binding protein, partial [Hyphomicrobium denitrificans]|nr:ABC transporter substrate-binding protein [Hyphomicrobium denitrificans]
MRSPTTVTSALSLALPRTVIDAEKVIKVGMLAPLSGKMKSWAEPGFMGCLIWKDWVNGKGGIRIGDRRYQVDVIPYDTQFRPEKALAGARKLLMDHGVQLVMMLGGNDFSRPLRDFVNQRKALVTTLLPSDLSPNARTLIAPCEVHPIYNVTGVEWLAQTRPELGSVAICSQVDELGLPSLATYRAAFKAANINITKEIQYDPGTTTAAGIVQPMLDSGADILCWCTSYTPMVHAMTEYAHAKGFKG